MALTLFTSELYRNNHLSKGAGAFICVPFNTDSYIKAYHLINFILTLSCSIVEGGGKPLQASLVAGMCSYSCHTWASCGTVGNKLAQ